MRRWFFRILVFVAIVLALAAGAVQMVLSSSYPENLVVRMIEQKTGMRVWLDDFETGWSGHTTLKHFGLILPTDDDDTLLIDFGHVDVDHDPLLKMLLTGDPGRISIRTAGIINLRQDATGQWNWQRAIDLVAANSDPNASPSALPKVDIDQAVVVVTTADGKTRSYDDIAFHAESLPPTAWRVKLTAGEQLTLEGSVNPVGKMHHELTLTANNIDSLLTPFVDTATIAPASAELHLIGDVSEDSYTARIDAKQLSVGEYEAAGTLSMTLADTVTFNPIALNITTGDDRLGAIKLTDGRIAVIGSTLHATALEASARDTTARITGTWNLLESRGKLSADWLGKFAAQKVDHHGSLTADLRKLAADRWHLETTIHSRGTLESGQWEADADVTVEGDPVGALTWSIKLPRGRFASIGAEPITLDRFTAAGHADVSQRQWDATATIDDFAVPGDSRLIDIKLTAAGNADAIAIDRLALTREDAAFTAHGVYTFADKTPLNLQATVAYEHAMDDPSRPDVPPWAAAAQWTGDIGGSFSDQTIITADGSLAIDDIIVNQQTIDAVTVKSSARWEDGALSLSTETFEMLGGTCTASGAFNPQTMTTQLKLAIDKVSLSAVSTVVNPELNLEGLASAQLQVHLPRGVVDRVRAEGTWEVENFQRDKLTFDRMTGRLSTRGRVLSLDPIVLLKDTGRAEGRVMFNLQDGNTLRAELRPQQWPLDANALGLAMAVDGSVAFDVDITEQVITGDINLQSDLAVEAGGALGRIAVVGKIDEQAIQFTEIHGTLGEGEIDGEATVDLADISKSTGLITLKSFAPTALSGWKPGLSKINGKLDATIQCAAAADPRAPEPLRLDVNWTPVDQAVVVERLQFGAGSMVAYIGPRRTIIDQSTIALAEGEVKVWASFSPHVDQWYNHLRLSLHDLNTNVLAEALRTEPGEPVPGKLSGHFNAIGPVGDWQALVGRGELTLADSNFVNTDILGGIMRLIGSRPTEPVGYGNVQARLERGMIVIDRFKYANRSTEILLDGVIEDITQGMASPIKLNALASVRPFKGIPILGTGEIDRMIRGIESNLSSVRVDGTLAKPDVHSATFAETASTIKKLLTDQRKQEQNN